LIVVPLILFVLIYTCFARLGWLAVVPALIFGVIWSYVGVPLVTRLVNRYVRLEGAPE
jgi:hypothetical protein